MAPRLYHLGPTISQKPFKGAEFSVRIANDLRKSTVFLGEEVADEDGASVLRPQGTGFFVEWRSDSVRPIDNMVAEDGGIYLVTARHVAVPLGTHFWIGYNRKGGGSDNDFIENAMWKFHSDPLVDIAVLHCGYPVWADCIPIPGRMLTKPTVEDVLGTIDDGEFVLNNPNLGIGDIAYVVGLFHLMRGKKTNLPVVHTGHIALLPEDERIPVWDNLTKSTQWVEGYLVEAQGLEGLSGAPVFARPSAPVSAPYFYMGPPLQGGHKMEHPVVGRLHTLTRLLGLWMASWKAQPSTELAAETAIDVGTKVPLGMGIVVPANKIAETLNNPELTIARRNEYERRVRDTAATTDSLPRPVSSPAPTPAAAENPHHREDFTSLLNAAAKTKPQAD